MGDIGLLLGTIQERKVYPAKTIVILVTITKDLYLSRGNTFDGRAWCIYKINAATVPEKKVSALKLEGEGQELKRKATTLRYEWIERKLI